MHSVVREEEEELTLVLVNKCVCVVVSANERATGIMPGVAREAPGEAPREAPPPTPIQSVGSPQQQQQQGSLVMHWSGPNGQRQFTYRMGINQVPGIVSSLRQATAATDRYLAEQAQLRDIEDMGSPGHEIRYPARLPIPHHLYELPPPVEVPPRVTSLWEVKEVTETEADRNERLRKAYLQMELSKTQQEQQQQQQPIVSSSIPMDIPPLRDEEAWGALERRANESERALKVSDELLSKQRSESRIVREHYGRVKAETYFLKRQLKIEKQNNITLMEKNKRLNSQIKHEQMKLSAQVQNMKSDLEMYQGWFEQSKKPECDNMRLLDQTRKSLVKAETSLRDMKTCRICLSEGAEIRSVALPCGHFHSCDECLERDRRCSQCRTVIAKTVRIYWP